MIFILGGLGFVGSAMARYCERQGWEHAVIDRHNYDEFVGQSCDVLVNANGNSRKPLARTAPMEDFDGSTRSVRASLVDFSAATYVFLSTCDVYPDCSSPATTREEMAIDVAAQSPYGFHKYLAEQCVRHAARRWLIIRQGGFVGPGLRKNAIYDILNGGPLWLDPQTELQFLHTDENARILFSLLDSGVSNEVVNVCGRGLIKLEEALAEAKHAVPVTPGSPVARYEVSTAKAEQWVTLPDTRSTVLDFVRQCART